MSLSVVELEPVRLDETVLVIDQASGEVTDWKGLNTDVERCPGVVCTACPTHCVCAPCRCEDCVCRDAEARRAAPVLTRLVLF